MNIIIEFQGCKLDIDLEKNNLSITETSIIINQETICVFPKMTSILYQEEQEQTLHILFSKDLENHTIDQLNQVFGKHIILFSKTKNQETTYI